MKAGIHKLRRGFTLVELMIALLITGILTVVIYSLFDTTSANFVEVDNLADTTDRLRFASERLRNDMQMAGAHSTPDSTIDDFVQPKVAEVRVAGVMPYSGWQDDTSMYGTGVAAANPATSMDGIVVMGAFDFPLSFEVSGLVPNDGEDTAEIKAHQRGLLRLNVPDPFRVTLGSMETFVDQGDGAVQDTVTALFEGVTTRLIRVTDRQGFQQFIAPVNAVNGADNNDFAVPPVGENFNRVRIDIGADNAPLGPKFKREADGVDTLVDVDYGLDGVSDGDVGYDAAFVDAFWYHVIQDPQNEFNMQLVRDRLCAESTVTEFAAGTLDPADNLGSVCASGVDERVVIANNVADFQVWFDCADPVGNGGIVGSANSWSTGWEAPNPETDPAGIGGCMASGTPFPGQARVAHVRLSLHTPTERRTQAHLQFENRLGALSAPSGTSMLRTFDPYPKVVGASQVVTMQTDIELTNFAQRNAL